MRRKNIYILLFLFSFYGIKMFFMTKKIKNIFQKKKLYVYFFSSIKPYMREVEKCFWLVYPSISAMNN